MDESADDSQSLGPEVYDRLTPSSVSGASPQPPRPGSSGRSVIPQAKPEVARMAREEKQKIRRQLEEEKDLAPDDSDADSD